MKALIVNRIGDFGLSLGIFAIFFVYGAVDYATVFAVSGHIDDASSICIASDFCVPVRDAISICLFIGAVGKSAQIGLHTWLPDAMEGFSLRWALLKLHYMQEHPLISWSTQNPGPAQLSSAILFGKIQEMSSVTVTEGQSAGNCKGSSETTREALHTPQGSLSEMAKPTTEESFSSLKFKQ